jgi:type VI secretion system protein ImpF
MSKSRDALQPALLDRLRDDGAAKEVNQAYVSKDLLRQFVLRDLEMLFNSTCVLSHSELNKHPNIASSVLAYGMPAIAGKVASSIEIKKFEHSVAVLIRRFEPRIDPDSVVVKAQTEQSLLHYYNVIGLTITGLLWGQPYPIELALRTEVDLETAKWCCCL